MLYSLTRLNLSRPEAGILRVLSGATVSVFDTMPDGSSSVLEDGTVQPGATKTILYADAGGVVTQANPMLSNSEGLVLFYSKRQLAHIQVVLPDNTTYGIPNYSIGGYPALDVGDSHVDLRDFATLNLAIAALGSHKGTVHCPAAVPTGEDFYHANSAKGAIKKNTIIPARVSLKGDGHRGGYCTVFVLNDGNDPNADYFTLEHFGAQKIEGIYFRGLRDTLGGGSGRVFILDGVNGTKFSGIFMDQICGICLETVFTSGIDNVNLVLEDVGIQASGNHSLKFVTQTFHTVLSRVGVTAWAGYCIWNNGQNLMLHNCAIEPNDDVLTPAILQDFGTGKQLCIYNTWFEYNPTKAPGNNTGNLKYFIEFVGAPAGGSYGSTIENCRFVRASVSQSLRAVKSSGNAHFTMKGNIGIFGNSITITGTDDIQLAAGDRLTLIGEHKRMRDDLTSGVSDWTIAGAGTVVNVG